MPSKIARKQRFRAITLLFDAFVGFLAGLTQAQLAACVFLQLCLGIEQADGYPPGLCLLAEAMDMHDIRFGIDHKVSDRHRQLPPSLVTPQTLP